MERKPKTHLATKRVKTHPIPKRVEAHLMMMMERQSQPATTAKVHPIKKTILSSESGTTIRQRETYSYSTIIRLSREEITPALTPINAFKLLFTDQLFELVWKQTNIYGKQKHGTTWVPVAINEIKRWIGLNILMGYHTLPSYKHYWSSNRNFNVPLVCNAMPRNLFTKILTHVHLADNKKMPPRTSSEYSRTYKLDGFFNALQTNFKKNYTLGQHVSVDESMIKFKGRSCMKQYLPMKPTKRGFKVWMLADSANGYVYNFRIYTGKDQSRITSLGEHVVKDMVRDIEFSYRQVYFDNYFTTPGLLEYLYKKGIYAAGTIRANRKNMPKDFCRSTTTMSRVDFEYITSVNLVVHKWMDKKLVSLLSNFHDPTSYDIVQRKKKDGGKSGVKWPTSIIDYNKYMGGVDRADQRRECYALDRKARRSWLRIFFTFLNITLSNAFVILKNRTNTGMAYLDFLSSITTSLIDEGTTVSQPLPSKNSSRKKNRASGRKISFNAPDNTESHLPIISGRARCAMCSTKKDVHVSIYHCSHCKRAFCMNQNRNCFLDYHKIILRTH